MGIIWDLLYCIHQCGWNISLQVLLLLFKAKHMVVCVCVLMWICRNCKAIVWMRVRRERSDQDQHKFLPNTLLSLLEPCLAVILKKSELRTDGGGSPRLIFFPVFLYFFDIFLHFFVWEYGDSCFSVAWITSIKETVGRDKRNIQLILHCVMNKI